MALTVALPAPRTVYPHIVCSKQMNLSYKFSLYHLFFPVPCITEMLILFIQSEQGWLETKLLLLS